MEKTVSGTFDVALAPISTDQESVSRMSIDKQFRGPLEATSKGQMMMSGVEAHGARVYVALETVTGSLDGRDGSFILAHRGTMTPDSQELSVVVVPGSGDGELTGLSGEMTIDVSDGQHAYTFTFQI